MDRLVTLPSVECVACCSPRCSVCLYNGAVGFRTVLPFCRTAREVSRIEVKRQTLVEGKRPPAMVGWPSSAFCSDRLD